jgi:hypothetical protein
MRMFELPCSLPKVTRPLPNAGLPFTEQLQDEKKSNPSAENRPSISVSFSTPLNLTS